MVLSSSIAGLTRYYWPSLPATNCYPPASLLCFYRVTRRFVVGTTSTSKHQQLRICKTIASFSTSSSSSFNEKMEATEAATTKQTTTTAPYGSWKSPITADVVCGASKRLGGTAVDASGRLIWLESRPSESGYIRIVFILCM